MKKEITFNDCSAILERVKCAAMITLSPLHINDRLTPYLAELADALNDVEFINVFSILNTQGKLCFTVNKGIRNNEVLDAVCDAITRVFDANITIANVRI